MELFNFSADETRQIHRALRFVTSREVDLDQLSPRTLIVKTENFEDECHQVARYFPPLGLESGGARLVFNTAKDGNHKILLNKEGINGLSYIHTLVMELVHLGNLSRYNADHGNVYRLEAEQAIADHYYEFLLWSRFQAMRIATRAHALVAWHQINGEAPPADGRYRFAQVAFPGEGVRAALADMEQSPTLVDWRENLWNLLEELALYLGRLAFYQQKPHPEELDDQFPAGPIEATVGLANCLALDDILLRAGDYPAWLVEKQALRRVIVTMQEQGKRRYPSEH